jgi:hypothetical protein
MELEPSVYRCATHSVDLSELVREQVAERTQVLYERPEDYTFRVVVTCPGNGSPHQLGCSGRILDDH